MKAEINDTTHVQFVGLYVNQNVLDSSRFTPDAPEPLFLLKPDDISYVVRDKVPLSLRSISSLTEEELIELGKIVGIWSGEDLIEYNGDFSEIKSSLKSYGKSFVSLFKSGVGMGAYEVLGGDFMDLIKATDYLRSIGILLPYRGIPKEEIIQNGWAVIRKEETE
jgi:hypothetical protein